MKMSEVNEAMQDLTAQWYNALVTGLGLSSNSFQLYQGPNSMMSTSQAMWNLFNAVPPATINNYNDPASANNFSDDYSLILSSIKEGGDSSFQTCMGDFYLDWNKYLIANMPETLDVASITKVFNGWALTHPSQAGCLSNLTKMYNNPVNLANQMLQNAGGKYPWNKTINDLQTALNGGAAKSFKMDSATASSDTNHTWAKGGVSAFFDIFSFGGSGSYDHLTQKTTTAGISIDASFQKFTTFQAGPLSQNDASDPVLSGFSPWYNGAAMALAYTTKDNTVWNNAKPTTWEKAFGTNGFVQRLTSALVVADGVEITMTSSATFSSSDQTDIEAAAKVGIWPFFSGTVSGGQTTKVTFDDAGKMTAVTSIPLGNPQIIGILQTPMSSIFS